MDEMDAAGATAPESGAAKGKKPEFSVKMNGNYVGSAWLKDGKYGPYLSVAVHEDVPKGSNLYVNPTRANPGILG